MIKVVIQRRAFKDLDSIHNYISLDNPEAADRVVKTALMTVEALIKHPESGPLVLFKPPERYEGLRYCVIPGYKNYLMFYRIEGSVIRILRFLHGAQNLARFFGAKEE